LSGWLWRADGYNVTTDLDSIEVKEAISTDGGTWRRRLPFFGSVEDESMCEIQRRQKTERKTLGVFRPGESWT
jgi:hypothetical protein